MSMQLICPECKNSVDVSQYPNLKADDVIECNVCGITLLVKSVEGEIAQAEVVDEGK